MTRPTDYSIEELRTLLLEHLDGSISPEKEKEVLRLLQDSPEASRELEALKRLVHTLETDKTVFCPDLAAISEFVATGHDPDGQIALHLKECESCADEAKSLKSFRPAATIPPEIWGTVSGKLAEQKKRAPSGEASELSPGLFSWFSSVFRMPLLAIGSAVAVAILVVVFVYPRQEATYVVGTSLVTWGDHASDLVTKLPVLPPGTQRTTFLLLLRDVQSSFPQERVDELYEALRPTQEIQADFHLVPPSQLKDIVSTEEAASHDQKAVLRALRQRLHIHRAVLVMIAPDGDLFSVSSLAVDTGTGEKLGSVIKKTTSGDALPTTVKEIGYAQLGKQ